MTHNQDAHETRLEDDTRAVWSLARESRPVVLFLDDPAADRPAYRWPEEPMPGVRDGHIVFGPSEYPTLERARELLPEYGPLWDAVAADIRAARPVPRSYEHDRFFALPV